MSIENLYQVCLGNCRKCKLHKCFTNFSPSRDEVAYFLKIGKQDELGYILKQTKGR